MKLPFNCLANISIIYYRKYIDDSLKTVLISVLEIHI